MGTNGEKQVLAVNAGAVVLHPYALAPPLLQLEFDAPCTGIDTVLQQLLDHRGGTFNHLTGSDLIGQLS